MALNEAVSGNGMRQGTLVHKTSSVSKKRTGADPSFLLDAKMVPGLLHGSLRRVCTPPITCLSKWKAQSFGALNSINGSPIDGKRLEVIVIFC